MVDRESGASALLEKAPRQAGAFKVERAFKHVERLAAPRRVGTSQELRAARYILRVFAALGLAPRREQFRVPYVAREVGTRLIFAACVAATLFGAWVAESWPLVAVACWTGAGLLVNAPWRLTHGLSARWPTALTSGNLVARLPGMIEGDAPARVVFMAHYDTKSQLLPTGLRVGLVIASTMSCGLLVAVGLAMSSGLVTSCGVFMVGLSVALAAALTVLAVNVTGNRSPGALDNATGVGTLLELARTWRPRPDAPLEVLWVATGAEEVGLDGARDFLRRRADWLWEKPTLVINLDSVGAGQRIHLAGEPGALRLACESADGLGIAWARLRVLGAGMDHEPFAARGLAAVSLLGDVVGRSLDLHSPRDRLEFVDRSALGRAGRLAGQLAGAWAERYRPGGPGIVPPRSVEHQPGRSTLT